LIPILKRSTQLGSAGSADDGRPPGAQPSRQISDFKPASLGPRVSPSYSQVMTGPGRWFHMKDPDGAVYGILFTNDADVLGLIGLTESSGPLLSSGITALRQAFAKGVRTIDQFDYLFGLYGPGSMTGGELADIFP